VSITSANVWYADPDLAVTERQWISLCCLNPKEPGGVRAKEKGE